MVVAHVVVSRFADSLPLYRQAQMLARQGIALDRSTLANWVGRACWWLTPLHDRGTEPRTPRRPMSIPRIARARARRHAWLVDHVGRVSGTSGLTKAIRYAIRHWPGLVVFLDDGRVEMDTNVVERAIRPHTLTRKNALFAGSDGGARHWAIAMTLIQTAKLNGVDPMAWLADVLDRMVSGRTKAHELATLLPWNWRPPPALKPAMRPYAAAA